MIESYRVRAYTRDQNFAWGADLNTGTKVDHLMWEELRHGGCGAGQVTIVGSESLMASLPIALDQEVYIDVKKVEDDSHKTRYCGFIKSMTSGVGTGDRKKRVLELAGMFEQYSKILVYRFYDGLLIGKNTGDGRIGIVESLMTDVIQANNTLTTKNTLSEVDQCGFTVARVDFDDDTLAECIRMLADLWYDDIHYGVDRYNRLVFKNCSSATKSYYLGDAGTSARVRNFVDQLTLDGRVNHVIVKSKTQMAGGDLTIEVYDPELDIDPNLRRIQQIIRTAEFSQAEDVYRFAEAQMEMNKDVRHTATVDIGAEEDRVDVTLLTRIYDENSQVLGTFSTNAATYELDENGINVSLEIGSLKYDGGTEYRRILQEQMINTSKQFSDKLQVSAGDYQWLLDIRRQIANDHQTRNFWGSQTDNDDSMDIPDDEEEVDVPAPVWEEGKNGCCGVARPQDENEDDLTYTTVTSNSFPTLINRDSVVAVIDNQFRVIRWRDGEFGKYIKVDRYGNGGAFGGQPIKYWDKNAGYLRPHWDADGLSRDNDVIVWYEAVLDLFTDPKIYMIGLEDITNNDPVTSNEQFSIMWEVDPNQTYIENCYEMVFDKDSSGNLDVEIIEHYLGADSTMYSGTISAVELITGGPWWRVYIERTAGTSTTQTRVHLQRYVLSTNQWIDVVDTGELNLTHRKVRSFWGARWNMNLSIDDHIPAVKLAHVKFSGELPEIEASRDGGVSWTVCPHGILRDISSQPAPVDEHELIIRANITHYHIMKGWGLAFK